MLFKDLHTNGLLSVCGGHWQKQGVPPVGFHAPTHNTPALEHIFHSWQYMEEYLAVGTKFPAYKYMFSPLITRSAQRVPEPDPLPSISFDTRPDLVLEIIG